MNLVLILCALIIPKFEEINFPDAKHVKVDEVIIVEEMSDCIITYKEKGKFDKWFGIIANRSKGKIYLSYPNHPFHAYFYFKEIKRFKTRKDYLKYRSYKFFRED
jgi:hypothetical protein